MKFIYNDDEDDDVKLPDLRDGLTMGMPGVGDHCHFAGRRFPFQLDGPWMTLPGVGVHSAGQATHQ